MERKHLLASIAKLAPFIMVLGSMLVFVNVGAMGKLQSRLERSIMNLDADREKLAEVKDMQDQSPEGLQRTQLLEEIERRLDALEKRGKDE